MIIFILIFFAVLIAAGVSAVAGFSIYRKRNAVSLESNNQRQLQEGPPYRSLFEPSDEEIRALEREKIEREKIENREAAQRILFEKAQRASEFQTVWRENPNGRNTAELFRLAAQTQSAKFFSETAQSVIQVWRENKIKNLTAPDLADLLDSHLGILSQQERASGATFWLKQEIEGLRRNSE